MKVVVHHAKSGIVSLNVLTAALRADRRTADVEVVFAHDTIGDEVKEVAAGDVLREQAGKPTHWDVLETSSFIATDAPFANAVPPFPVAQRPASTAPVETKR